MNHYAIRLDGDTLPSEIIEGSLRYITAFENSDKANPHYHLYVITVIKQQAMRKRIKKHFTGNGQYSLKNVDRRSFPYGEDIYSIKYIAYLFKEDPNPLVENFPMPVIEAALEYDAKVKNEILEKSSSRKENVYAKILTYVEEYLRARRDLPSSPGTHYLIAEGVLQWHLDTGRVIRRASIQAYVDTIYLVLVPGSLSTFIRDTIRM